MTDVPLLVRQCRPLINRPAMDATEVEQQLRQVPNWQLVAGAIERRFEFGDFDQTMRFVNAVADLARAEDHHPSLLVTYNSCTLRFDTHSVQGLSINDFICAAKVDALQP